jgi:glyoxylase I family protein
MRRLDHPHRSADRGKDHSTTRFQEEPHEDQAPPPEPVLEGCSGHGEFYRSVLDLAPEPSLNSARDTAQGYAAPVAFVTDGQTQVHLATKDLGVAFRTNHIVNPLERGHIAFRTDDIAAFKRRLEERNILYSDYGQWAMNGWHQIFFYDPEGNVIEVHQDMNA